MIKLLSILLFYSTVSARDRWTEDQANAWYKAQSFIIGSMFIPSDAGNQLEMWQADTFNPTLIDKELSWAGDLGMTTMRIFLHDIAYTEDPSGFKSRLETVIKICTKYGIKPTLTLFDSDWNRFPTAGKQPQPKQGVMLSTWVQSPSIETLGNKSAWVILQAYVKDVIGTYANDHRVLIWDLMNEPGHGDPQYNKTELIDELLPQIFEWARAVNPIQPLTAAIYNYEKANFGAAFDSTERICVNYSDILSFHDYDPAPHFETTITNLQKFNRPVICSEYMAREMGSQFVTHIPVGKKYNVGLMNWGFVDGKIECNYPWDSHKQPYIKFQPWIWFHQVLRKDGSPYLAEETNVIKSYTGCPKGHQSKSDNWTCYYAYTSPLSWNDAQDSCRKNGTYLVSIKSAFENTDLKSFLSTNYSSCNSFYIGLYSHYNDWIWSDYDNSTFTAWKNGYPTNDAHAKCVVLNQDGTWSNQACTNPQCYVCSF